MATSKQIFGGLVKYIGTSYATFEGKFAAGKIVYGEITEGEKKGKYIYANGILYNIADGATLADLSTYVHNEVDSSIDRLDSSVSALETWKEALELAVANNVISIAGVDGSVTIDASGNYIGVQTVGQEIKIDVKATHNYLDVSAATADDTSLADTWAVKKFVEDKLGDLANAMVFRGGVNSESELPSDAKTGDTYVALQAMTVGGKKIDAGDLFIWNGESWIVVERNLDGAVTAADTLVENRVVLGGGNQTVKTEVYTIGVYADSEEKHFGDASALAREWAVKDYVDGKVSDLSIGVSPESSTYIELSAKREESGKFIIDASASIVKMAEVSETKTGLADAKDVKGYVDGIVDGLDVTSTEAADKILVGVSEDNGKVASTAAGLKINGVAFTHAVEATDMTATIDGSVILVGGESAHKDSSIAKAIADLSTAIDAVADNNITGEDELAPAAGHTAVDDYVAVSANKDDEGNVTLDSSVLVVNPVDVTTINGVTTQPVASGLATDAYVQAAIIEALAWEVVTD